ncbi:ABC transporter ATP-binding protein [[Clostridium] symbiosum]|uniref:ABC transporter ATP-binding protein n=1 Tax=Clostridium symbiosum TaxID=1512 RepID=UPI001D0882B3|nr:ABC transporter ATP-binding protein [[Clostridium] symbiosum]MCB6608273.1 ABC transporter ATP-binding protein [[Clostridium] symbiosum]MCB6932823.1 ABC transporter ATP-binding protein [[Clostridium] symbiosum]
MDNDKILEIKNLFVKFPMDGGAIHAVNGVNLSLGKGETLGIVGESGCGKSVTMSAILRLLKTPPAQIEGEIYYKGQNILDMPMRDFTRIRGKEISMIFQEPMTSLDPVIKIGPQIAESLMLHERMLKNAAMAKALELLKQVEIPNAEKRINDYPHQLSGGMRQRVMIAMALACKPQILLADEPTTALDVTIQAQIMDLIKKLRGEYGMSIMIVTHDLGVISDVADRVVVFYSGQIVEEAYTADLFKHPKHPYTKGLLTCIPTLQTKASRLQVIEGNIADPANRPSGCPFHPRCQYATERCEKENPKLHPCGDGHLAACHLMEGNG